VRRRHHVEERLAVAVQVDFESKGLKPAYRISGSRVETRRFQALWVNSIQLVQPRLDEVVREKALRR
jgi:hypothetical protein